MPFQRIDDLPPTEMFPGLLRRAVHLEHTMLTIFDFETGVEVPEHDHPHEQISYVQSGRLEFRLGDETRVLGPGDTVCIPPGVTHWAKALEPTRALDAWYPVREDYK